MNYVYFKSAEKELFPCAFLYQADFLKNFMFSRNETIFLLSI